MIDLDWFKEVDALTESPKPFQRGLCPVVNRMEELCPVSGLSLDGMNSKQIRGEIALPLGWGLIKTVGFETRFHKRLISNVSFRLLHKGFTKGSMLVCFSEDELWMRNLHNLSGNLDLGGEKVPCQNLWKEFLGLNLRAVEPEYRPEDSDDNEWFSFRGEARVNGMWFSFRPPTAAGSVIDVPNYSGEGQPELPCEIPLTFRDLDYLHTQRLLLRDGAPPFHEAFGWLCENYFGSHGKPALPSRLLQGGAMSFDTMRRYVELGHGFLGMLKGERERLGFHLTIPQLELRHDTGG